MSKETTPNKLPYPEKSDPPAGPAQIKALADRLEGALGIRGIVNGEGPTVTKGKGFSVTKTETGKYKITLDAALSERIVCTANSTSSEGRLCSGEPGGVSDEKKEIHISVFNKAGERVTSSFAFHITTPTGE